jgi:transcriptional adapter 2-alpha
MLQIYNLRLDEREQRRVVVRQHGLLNIKRQQAIDRKRAPQDKEGFAQCRLFARCVAHCI